MASTVILGKTLAQPLTYHLPVRVSPDPALFPRLQIILTPSGRRIFRSFSRAEAYGFAMNKILSFLAAAACLLSIEMLFSAETAKQPAVGAPAPDFSLSSGDGSHVSLKDYRGKWVVLYFYPKDFTSGCTLEAKNFESRPGQPPNAEKRSSWRERPIPPNRTRTSLG